MKSGFPTRLFLSGIALLTATMGRVMSDEPGETKVRSVLKAVAPRCFSAKNARTLAPLRAELAKLRREQAEDPGLAEKLQGGLFFVEQWSAYIDAQAKGDKASAVAALEKLLADRSWLTLAPRSKVLERIPQRPEFFYVRYPTRTLEDFWKAIEKLEELERKADAPGMMSRATGPLKELQVLWELRSAENVDRIARECRPDGRDSIDVTLCKQLILAHVIGRFLKLDSRYLRAPGAEESAPEYLRAEIQRARKNCDLIALWRMENYLAFLTEDQSAWTRATLRALDSCLAGRKLEAAGNLPEAVRSYGLALIEPAEGTPAAFASGRLTEIARTHPDAAAEGRLILNASGEVLVADRVGRFVPRSNREMPGIERFTAPESPERAWSKY